MQYLIKYTPHHKEVLENAINLALEWHAGNVQPICDIMLKAFKRHHEQVENLKYVIPEIQLEVERIRKIDSKGKAFGDNEVLKGIRLSESGESLLSEQEAFALERLTELVARLICGQLNACFDGFTISYIDLELCDKLYHINNRLHCYCWGMPINASYGLHYDRESDILWDLYQVLRHERYLNFSDKEKAQMRWTVMADAPMHSAQIPLLEIKTFR